MKVKAMVVDDIINEYPDKETGKPRQSRTLVLVDQDDDNRLESTFRLSIQTDDKVAGPKTNIRGAVVLAAITRIMQSEWNKALSFGGHLLSIEGAMVFQKAAAAPGPLKG